MASEQPKPKYGPFPMEILSQDNGNYGTYTANCHCGHLRYEVKLSPPIPEQAIVSCNCSICSRNGYLLAYAPRENVRFLRGGNDVAKYSFNRHLAKHAFCPKCGSSAYVENDEVKDLIAVNVRMINGIDLDSLNVTYVHGATHSGTYPYWEEEQK